MKTRMHKALSLVVSIAFVCALAPRWQIATVQAQLGAPVASTTLPDRVAFQVDSDVNFVGTVTDIGGGIGFAYWIVEVQNVLFGPPISGQVSVGWHSDLDWCQGAVDPDIQIGHTVEVFGDYDGGGVGLCGPRSAAYYIVRTNLTAFVVGKVTVTNPDGGGLVPLREIQVELLHNGVVIATKTTIGGDGDSAGIYSFGVTSANPGNYRVRATLKQPPDPVQAIGGFEVKYMPPLLGDPIPYVETANFSFDENFVRRDLEFGPSYVESGGNTNLGLSDRQWLDDLAVVYYHIQQAERFAIEQLEIDNLGYVSVHAFDSHDTGYQASDLLSDSVIFVDEDGAEIGNQDRPDNREWHEYFHHVMAETNLTDYPPRASCGNHQGFLNETTGDSWAEGWAEFWATVLGEHLGYGVSDLYLDDIILDKNFKSWNRDPELFSWVTAEKREDLAVASLLWDLYDIEEGDNSQDDHDRLSLRIDQLRDVVLQEDSPGRYTQIETVQDLYNVLVEEYPASYVDEIFIAHGFFGDRGWSMQGCNEPSQPGGNQDWDAGEVIGQGGREGRSNLPLVEGANLLVNLRSERGSMVQSGELIVRYRHPSPYDMYDRTIYRKASNGSLFHLEPSPAWIPTTVQVQGDSPHSTVWTSSNSDYWAAVAESDQDYIAEVTFTVKPASVNYLPVILKSYDGSQPTNRPPNTPSTPSPANGATNQSVNVDLGWTGGDPDGDSVTYDVYLEADDSTPDVLRCNDVTNTSCDPGALNPGTYYYWQVIARDEHGAIRTGPVWDFTTESTAFFDDFSDPNSGWPTGASENCEFGYYDGRYRLRVTGNGQRCIVSNPNVPLQVNGIFTVRARRVSEENRLMLYGLMFGAGPDPAENRWALEIYPNDDPNCANQPFYWLTAFVNGERRYFRTKCTGTINKGEGDWNDLKVIRDRENIDIYINGQHKGEYSDADYLLSEGYLLLGGVSLGSDTIEVEFDDFKVLSSTDITSF